MDAIPLLPLDAAALGPPEEPALIGVSGGRDSVALLHALVQRGHTRLIVCHLDHGWRSESAQDAAWVQALAAAYGLAARVEHVIVTPATEAAGRDARRSFFARAAARHQCRRVYLAHHADDLVETLLLNLLRGAGAAGLAPLTPLAPHQIDGLPLELARPLLHCWRETIDAYVQSHGLTFRQDASNADLRYTRNRVRAELLPGLEAIMRRPVRESLWKTATLLASENAYFEALPEIADLPEQLSVTTARAWPEAVQRRAVHAWLRGAGIAQVDFDSVEGVRGLLHQRSPAKVNLCGGWHARRRAGMLFLESPAAPKGDVP